MIYLKELQPYIVEQNYHQYNQEDFEVWQRITIQRRNLLNVFSHYIDPSYLVGLSKLDVLQNKIPRLSEINMALKKTGWSAVCVDGYIPARIYFLFIASKIFPISRNIRRLCHLEHSPVPDFIHDVLGHLPMLFIDEYQSYLLQICELAAKFEGNSLDDDLFKANHQLAIKKESLNYANSEIKDIEQNIKNIQLNLKNNSSILTYLNRMFLWSIEFGLIGTVDEFKCFGSGILSSLTELQFVLNKKTKIIPYSTKVIEYDINFTEPQEHFFVIKNYTHLTSVLNAFKLKVKEKNFAVI